MSDDIVTRLRMPYDQEGTTNALEMMAADEIERLRAELKRQSLQANIMRNVAMVPYGDSAGVIEELMADRNRWRATAEVLARELGKVEYADAEYQNQEGLH